MAQVLLLGAAAFLLSGCASSGYQGPISVEEIPEGADRIVINRIESEQLVSNGTPAFGFYTDVTEFFETKGIEVAQSDPDNLILTTEPTEVKDSLRLRFNMNFEPIAGGSRMIASAEYANADDSNWQTAAWTDGASRSAFTEALEILDGLGYSEFATAVRSDDIPQTETGASMN